MRFFKHFTDAHEGRSMMTLFDELGHAGPNCYWILLELCAAKVEKNTRSAVNPEDCIFRFHERLVRDKFRLGATKVQRWFNLAATLDLLSFEITENEIRVSIPKLLEILEHRPNSCAEPAQIRAQEEERDKDKEKKERERGGSAPPPPAPRKILDIWNELRGPALPEAKELSKAREAKARSRLADKPSLDYWRNTVLRIANSKFCTGNNDRHWRATFDWLLQPDTHLKVNEGKYDGGADSGGYDWNKVFGRAGA